MPKMPSCQFDCWKQVRIYSFHFMKFCARDSSNRTWRSLGCPLSALFSAGDSALFSLANGLRPVCVERMFTRVCHRFLTKTPRITNTSPHPIVPKTPDSMVFTWLLFSFLWSDPINNEKAKEVSHPVPLWRRANARNVRLYYPYWQYTDLFIFRFVSHLWQFDLIYFGK